MQLFKLLFSKSNHVDEIIPGVWMGDHTLCCNTSFIRQKSIDILVNCTPNLLMCTGCDLERIRIPVYDSLKNKDITLMEHYLAIVVPYLASNYRLGKRILIHCHGGKQRSGIVVAALLFTLLCSGDIFIPNAQNSSKKDMSCHVFSYILQRRYQAFTYGFRINFLPSFNNYFNIK